MSWVSWSFSETPVMELFICVSDCSVFADCVCPLVAFCTRVPKLVAIWVKASSGVLFG